MEKKTISLILDSRQSGRYQFLRYKLLLELAGFLVLESYGDWNNKQGLECRLVALPVLQGQPDFCFDFDKEQEIRQLESIMEESLFPRDVSVVEKELWRKICQKEIFRSLYTVTYLYANRKMQYQEKTLLLNGLTSLSRLCLSMEQGMEERGEGGFSWRFLYAYLYLVNRVNEGMKKIRSYTFRSYSELKKKIIWLKEKEPMRESISLLEAELLRNDSGVSRLAAGMYAPLTRSRESCVQFWSWYALGEIGQDVAEVQLEGRDLGEAEKSRFYQESLKCFEKSSAIKPDEIRLIYKFAVQKEREGYADRSRWDESEDLYGEILNFVGKFQDGQRNYLEFEYVYKAYLRLGWVYQLKGEYKRAKAAYEAAKQCWNELDDYKLTEWVYGGREEPWKVLNRKYENRERTFAINQKRIEEMLLRARGE